jgi:hypothetical protein
MRSNSGLSHHSNTALIHGSPPRNSIAPEHDQQRVT